MKTMSRTLAALGLLLSAFTATSASATVLTYDFTATPGTGPLAGNSYTGVLSFDDTFTTNPGFFGFLNQGNSGLSVSFTFESTTYTNIDDANYANYPLVSYVGGTFVGLSFVVDGVFSLGSEATNYDIGGADFEYQGSEPFLTLDAVTYTLRTGDTQPVPEPATLAVLGAGLIGLGMIRRRTSRG